MVMPKIIDASPDPIQLRMVTQRSRAGGGTRWGGIGVWIWAALLALGAWGLWTAQRLRNLRLVLAVSVLGQMGLHLLYGEETFLFSLHWLPLRVIVAAFGTLTKHRRIALV